MNTSKVEFKANSRGLYIHFDEGEIEELKIDLKEKLKESKGFFKGAKVIGFKGREFEQAEIEELVKEIEDGYDILVDFEEETEEKEIEEEVLEEVPHVFEDIDEGVTKFIKHTIRSGQEIEVDGNLVVLGDVNAGSMVAARGNIFVFGTLRGMAHAGSNGNKNCMVGAFRLEPTQLRIADFIARAPDEAEKPKWPEIARIKDENLVIEPYLKKSID